MYHQTIRILLYLLLCGAGSARAQSSPDHPPIPVTFTLKEAGYVTLVIENDKGIRVRNLIAETWFPAGNNTVWWDGLDDLGRDRDAARHGVYHVPGRFTAPGKYRVRGLVRGAITPYYEFTTYSTGTPPWRTPNDHTGAWLANHTPPQAALFVPAALSPIKEPVVLLGCYVTEGPDGLAWVDMNGRKRGGKAWIGGTWTAAPFLAADKGTKAVAGVAAYVASVWETDKNSGRAELRINALLPDTKNDYKVKQAIRLVLGNMPREEVRRVIGGLAVHNGVAVVSLIKSNQLLFIDVAKGIVLDSATLSQPRGLAFDQEGRLLVLSGRQLLRFAALNANPALKEQQVLINTLEEPVALTIDDKGQFYISDRGQAHTVKIFDHKGAYQRQIGKPGPPKAGLYDSLHMNNPAGIAIDEQQRLWVTEEDFLPRRVSVWSRDGRLLQAFYGPPKYGGGGMLDAANKNSFYYVEEGHGAMEFTLDWDKGVSHLNRIYYRAGDNGEPLAWRSAGPEWPLYRNGQRYFTNCYNSNPTNGHATAFLFIERNGIAYPAAAMGRAATWEVLKEDRFKAGWPKGVDLNGKGQQAEAFFIWQDNNADARVQPGEVTFQKGNSGGVTVMPDLSFCIARLNNKGVQFVPAGFTRAGIPQYNIAEGKTIVAGVLPPASSGGDQLLTGKDGKAIITLGVQPFARESICGIKEGVPVWSYPNPWPGLHASHSAPLPDQPGQLIGPTRLLGGMMEVNPSVGNIWAINGNHGSVYLFTEDGLFVATLFEVMRKGKLWRMPVAYRNMKLDSISLGEENFWPGITRTRDGQVYLIDGARSSLVRLDGIDNIKRLPDTDLVITPEDLEKSRAWQLEAEARRQQEQQPKVLTIDWIQNKPVVDGKTGEWQAAQWIDIDKRGVKAYFNAQTKPYDLTAAAAIAGDRLYIVYKTGDDKLLQNSGEMPVAPFKTGGALDFMISTSPQADSTRKKPVAGDCRLLVTQVKGKTLALLYRAIVPGTKEADKIPFTSPVQTITFDKVEDVSSQVELAGEGGNYEISIPLPVLGLTPAAGTTVKGDIGLLRGEGGQTITRLYWSNKATGITADVPSEAMLTPYLWGTFRITKK